MRALKIFRIKPEERIQACVALVIIVALNAFFIYRLHEIFMQPGFGPYWKVFERELHLAGYDPYTYLTVTDWDVVYEVHRHPLLAFLIWPFSLLNQGLTWIFGVNCVQYVVALPVIFCSFYSYIFMYRIQREVIQLERWDATLLTVFFFSNAYILLSVIVPDHFTVSMFLLLITLYISGKCMQKGREFRWWQSAILFFITAGVTLSNGIKIFLAGFFVNLRDFFRPRYLLMAVILPAALLWGVAMWEYHTFTIPKEKSKTEQKMREAEQTIYENLFGESVQFHQEYFLEDTLVHRPVFVKYDWILSYWIEALVVLFFVAGIWCGRKSRFLWLCLSCFAFDMFIHLILGFGINEIHIMTPHWLFVIPIAMAFLLREIRKRWFRIPVLLLTLYLFTYNGYLLTSFLLSKLWIVL